MAQPLARPSVRLADFAQYAGQEDEDPDGHLERFEVVCLAQGIVEDDQKLNVFPATLQCEALSWFYNLDLACQVTYQALIDNFLARFRGLGFQEKLARQFDNLFQCFNEDIDHYIQRMETLVRRMGVFAPNDTTQKRKFIDGLCNLEAQTVVRLSIPIDLATAKQEARNWEEVEISQIRRDKLRYDAVRGLASSRAYIGDYFCINNHNKRVQAIESNGHNIMQEKVCALQDQLEQERMSSDQSIKSLLEKVSCLEIEKGKAQLEAKQNRELACKTNEYHIEEIAVLDEALTGCYQELESNKNYIKTLLDEIERLREKDCMRLNLVRDKDEREIDKGINTTASLLKVVVMDEESVGVENGKQSFLEKEDLFTSAITCMQVPSGTLALIDDARGIEPEIVTKEIILEPSKASKQAIVEPQDEDLQDVSSLDSLVSEGDKSKTDEEIRDLPNLDFISLGDESEVKHAVYCELVKEMHE